VSGSRKTPSKPSPAKPAKRGTAKRGTAERDSANRRPAKRDPAKRSPAKRGTAERDPAKRGTAERGMAERGTAKRDPAKRGTAKRGTAEQLEPAKRGTAERGSAMGDSANQDWDTPPMVGVAERPSDVAAGRPVHAIEAKDLDALRTEVSTLAEKGQPAPRWNADPDDVQRSVVRLVLALVEFIRRLLERQAIRRMEANTLTAEETERVGIALMRLEETIHDMAKDFGIQPEDLNLDLGPIGKLM
jgi:hypothetical protein